MQYKDIKSIYIINKNHFTYIKMNLIILTNLLLKPILTNGLSKEC